jgi:phosphoribosyl 1,2-cyclic phosphodiesterase
VEDRDSALLVDAGLSAREIERRLRIVGREPAGLQAVLLTHEHSDHVRGVRVFAARHGIPVYATEGTWRGLDEETRRELAPLRQVVSYRMEIRDIPGCGITVLPVRTEHDTNAPAGYVLTSSCGRFRAGVATDMGHEGHVPRELASCSLLVLEFNHDVALLRRNPRYPKHIKDRILGASGHLSNEQAARLLELMFRIGHGQRLESLVLAHLSEENNTPELALDAARRVLQNFRLHEQVEVKVAGPAEPVTVAVRR